VEVPNAIRQFSQPRLATNPDAEPTTRAITPGGSSRLDLVHLNAAVPGELIVDVRPQPPDRRNRLGETELVLRVQVNSDDLGRPRRYTLAVSYDGARWTGWAEPASSHLRVSQVAEQ
jgi:hypothetical protein